MRVLLIDPPFYRFIGYFNRYFPLGLSCLAAAVASPPLFEPVADSPVNGVWLYRRRVADESR